MQDFTTTTVERPLPRTPKNAKDPGVPVSLKPTADMEEVWRELVELYPELSKHAIGVAALRYGLLAIKKDPKVLMEMEQEAVRAKWLARLEQEKK